MTQPILEILKEDDLEDAASLLHDGWFLISDLRHDELQRMFSIAVTSVQRERFLLTFYEVDDCEIVVDEEVPAGYEFSTLEYREQDRKLHIVTHYAISITLEVARIHGQLRFAFDEQGASNQSSQPIIPDIE
ncbi:MAG: hypothetical protein L0219_10285 [Phycisphaerales bacterium]|nr:hypothetical protein [Phycisphaerales bacterium]